MMGTTQPKPTPRGLRNNNPGNLRKSKDRWQGLAEKQPDKEFFTFKSPAYGIRAIAVTLITYQDKHRRDSVKKIINRWAPPSENDTAAYIQSVADRIGAKPDHAVNVHRHEVMKPLVEAIIRHENGTQPYSAEVINEGLRLAGITPAKKKPVVKDPEINATTIVTGAGGIGAVAKVASEASDFAYSARPLLDIVTDVGPWVALGAIVICGGGYLLWRQWKRRQAEG